MRLLGLLLRRVSRISTHIGGFFHRVTELLNNVLPAILPPAELTRLIQSYYDDGYRGAADYSAREVHGTGLSTWETTVLTQYNITQGTILVLGAGVGREAIEFARKNLRVIGVDTNREALRRAVRTTQEERLSALFVQGNFYQIPALPAQADHIFLCGIMYSSIPGRLSRQAWLKKLSLHLKMEGLAILSFYINRTKESRLDRHVHQFNSWLACLPGGNPSYQPGDFVSHDHFLHAFLDETELRSELTDAGATIVQLNWEEQYVIVTRRI